MSVDVLSHSHTLDHSVHNNMSVDVRTLHAAKTGRRTVYARPLRVPRARCPRPTGPPPSDVPATPLPWWRAHQQDEDLENSSVLPKVLAPSPSAWM